MTGWARRVIRIEASVAVRMVSLRTKECVNIATLRTDQGVGIGSKRLVHSAAAETRHRGRRPSSIPSQRSGNRPPVEARATPASRRCLATFPGLSTEIDTAELEAETVATVVLLAWSGAVAVLLMPGADSSRAVTVTSDFLVAG